MKKVFVLLLFFTVAFSDPPLKYIVSNCENPNFNGEYLKIGSTFDYRPVYTKNDTYYLWTQGCLTTWSLADDSPFDYPCPDYCNTTVADLPPTDGYRIGGEGGVSPSNLTITSGDVPAPIELAYFIISQENSFVHLNWQTASETENNGFVIQRKTAGTNWNNLIDFHSDPSLVGAGTTSETNNYSYLDENVEPGTTYQYRLGDIDYANVIVWHDVREISVSEEAEQMPAEFGLQSAFPNPFNPSLTIKYGLTEDAHTSVKILDLQGKTIATLENKFQKAGSYELQWQAEDATSGMYLVKVISGEKSDITKVLLTK